MPPLIDNPLLNIINTNKSIYRTLLIITLIFQTVLILLFADKSITLILTILLVSGLIVFSAFSVEKTYYIFAGYIAIAPNYIYLHYFPGINIYYTLKFAFPLFALLLCYWLIYLCRSRENIKLGIQDQAFLIYFALVILSALRGFLSGFSKAYIIWDLSPHIWYLCYFIFRFSPLKTNIKRFYDIILVFAFIASLEFIYAFSRTEGLIFFKRIVGKNIHLVQFALPYVGATIIYGVSKKRKILLALTIPFMLAGVLFSQQRSLWFTTFLSIFILAIIYIYVKRKWIKKNVGSVFKKTLLIVFIALIFFSLISTNTKTKFVLTTLSRLSVFLNPSLFKYDLSWRARTEEVNLALKDTGNQWLFGKGYGASFVSTDRFFNLLSPDNSYVYFIWKMGILGLLGFLLIYMVFFRRCYLILSKTKIPDEKIFILAAILNTIGIAIISFSNSAFSQYEYQIIWVAVIAAIETIAIKYDKK